MFLFFGIGRNAFCLFGTHTWFSLYVLWAFFSRTRMFSRTCIFFHTRMFFLTCTFFRYLYVFSHLFVFSRLYVFFTLVCFFRACMFFCTCITVFVFARVCFSHLYFFSRAYSSCLCFLECPYVFFGCDYAYGLCNWNCACFRVTSQDMRGYHSHCIREAPFPHPL